MRDWRGPRSALPSHINSRHKFQFVRPGGVRNSIPAVWLNAYIDLMHSVQPGVGATAAAFPECIVDTGAHLTAIPERIWSYFKPGVITPLPFDPAMPQSLRVIAFGGGTYPYELGELRLRLRDLIGRAMDVTAVVQLIHDNGNLKISMVLGPRGGVLDNLSLRRYPDSTAPFGEAWILEDP